VNPDAKALTKNALSEKYRVRPEDLLDWAKAKNLPIPQELMTAIYGAVYETPTSAATESQEQRKRTRRKSIRQFADLVYARALDLGMDWAEKRAPINATKEEFKELFERKMGVQPEDRVKLETFKLDLKELGVQFARGVKKRPNNDLEKLFNA
jgi:polynucleotide 5'-kinase involved in rRNA processing